MRAGLRTNAKVVGNKSTPASVVGPTVAPYLYIPYHTVSYVVGSSSSVARKGAPPTRSRQYRCSSVRPSATACRYSAARRARYRRCRSAFVSGRVVVIAESYRATLHVATRASSGPGRCPSTAGHGQGRRAGAAGGPPGTGPPAPTSEYRVLVSPIGCDFPAYGLLAA